MLGPAGSARLDSVDAQVVAIRVLELRESYCTLDALYLTQVDTQTREPIALSLQVGDAQEHTVL